MKMGLQDQRALDQPKYVLGPIIRFNMAFADIDGPARNHASVLRRVVLKLHLIIAGSAKDALEIGDDLLL